MNAQQKFRAGHRRRFETALCAALAMVWVGVAAHPPLDPDRGRPEPPAMEHVKLPEDYVVPPPPREVTLPRIPIESLDVDEPEDDMPDTFYDPTDPAALPAAPPPGAEFRSWERAPTPVRVVQPEYPSVARAAGVEGEVQLLVTVGPDGAVLDVVVLSSTSEMFEEPARAALVQWRFQPAEQNGQPVAATVLVPVRFRLDP